MKIGILSRSKSICSIRRMIELAEALGPILRVTHPQGTRGRG